MTVFLLIWVLQGTGGGAALTVQDMSYPSRSGCSTVDANRRCRAVERCEVFRALIEEGSGGRLAALCIYEARP